MNFAFFFLLFFVLFSSFLLRGQTPAPLEVLIDDFSKNTSLGDFPVWWKTYPLQKGKAKLVYKVAEENGKRFIHAEDSQDISMPIFKDFFWPLSKFPILKWSWKARELPKGAKEDSRATNDSACGVYVAFGKTSGVAMKYVWSSTLPVGHVWEKAPGKFYVIVAASGSSALNKWQNEKINVMEDYKRFFKKNPTKDPSGIGIMTDGNATHSSSSCDYADFKISSGS